MARSLIEEPNVQASLSGIVASLAQNPEIRDDLMQEALVHLWCMERKRPGYLPSWYLQSCKFHLQHLLERGRSVDSLKRSGGDRLIPIDDSPDHPALDEHHTNGEFFDQIAFVDAVRTLDSHLRAGEKVVLDGLAMGLPLREVAKIARISYPTALKYRRKIENLTVKLGIVEAEKPTNGEPANRLLIRVAHEPKKDRRGHKRPRQTLHRPSSHLRRRLGPKK